MRPLTAHTPFQRSARWIVTIATFVTLVVPTRALAAPVPSLTAQPGSGQAGASITLKGTNFPARVTVSIVWDGNVAPLASATSSAAGAFGVQIKLPMTAKPGAHELRAASASTTASVSVLVLSAARTAGVSLPAADGGSVNNSFTSSASISSDQVNPGSSIGITGTFTPPSSDVQATTEINVFASSGQRVFQQIYPSQAFSAGQTRTYSANWSVPGAQPSGTYYVMTGAFAPDYSAIYNWNDSANRFNVSGQNITVNVDRSTQIGVSQFAPGVTHTQFSLDSWNDPGSVSAGKRLLQASTVYQNQHMMGWGANNPEPSPGVYDWYSLDQRIQLMRDTGGTPVITLCCAPDWMWGGQAGTTDLSKLGTPPGSQHYGDFVALVQQIARRYPDVKYYQVWNELKGFWSPTLNRWDYQGYTAFYNQIYDGLKAVSGDIRVGGPYSGSDSAGVRAWMSNPSNVTGPWGTIDQRHLDMMSYWLANKHGADFVTLSGWIANADGNQVADEFTETQKFAAMIQWIRQQTNLPIWWAEWYAAPTASGANAEYMPWDHNHQNALMAVSLIQMIRSGASVALRWQPQGVADQSYQGDNESIWSDSRGPGSGTPFPFFDTVTALRNDFPPGTPLYRVATSSSDVEAMSSWSQILLVNTRPWAVSVNMNDNPIELAPYQVRVLQL